MGLTLESERDFAGRQILGDRGNQEDAYSFAWLSGSGEQEFSSLIGVVADGMGGHAFGEIASEAAIEGFINYVNRHLDASAKHIPPQVLLGGVYASNAAVSHDLGKDAYGGTTLVGFTVHRGILNWISVGDSILGIHRNGQFRRLNEDHSLQAIFDEQVARGELAPEVAVNHPDRNVLQSAISGNRIELIDCPEKGIDLYPGDLIIAASDGIDCLLRKEAFAESLNHWSHLPSSEIAGNVIAMAQELNRGPQDNTTVMIVKVRRPYSIEV